MQSFCRKSNEEIYTFGSRTTSHGPAAASLGIWTVQLSSHWPEPLACLPGPICRRQCGPLNWKIYIICKLNFEKLFFLPLIIETSLAPSPIARVTAFFVLFISSTTIAFCNGVTRQHITALHWDAISRNLCSISEFRQWTSEWPLMTIATPLPSSDSVSVTSPPFSSPSEKLLQLTLYKIIVTWIFYCDIFENNTVWQSFKKCFFSFTKSCGTCQKTI